MLAMYSVYQIDAREVMSFSREIKTGISTSEIQTLTSP